MINLDNYGYKCRDVEEGLRMINIAICNGEEKDRDETYQLVQKYISRHNPKEYCIRVFISREQLLASDFLPDVLLGDIVKNVKGGIHVDAALKQPNMNAIIILYDSLTRLWEIPGLAEVTFLSEYNTIIKLAVDEIYYFEYCNRKIKIVTTGKIYVCVKEKIGDIARKMEKYGFAMSHQSFVVNMYYIERITPQALIMKNGDRVYLAQKRASTIRKLLHNTAK